MERKELRLNTYLIGLTGAPYKFGGRSKAGIDCSSLILRSIRLAVRRTVAELPWMTADQLGKGKSGITTPIHVEESSNRCILAFFDWDQDDIYEHAAVKLLDGTWIWASSSAGKVLRFDPTASDPAWTRQWREINGGLQDGNSTLRVVDWSVASKGGLDDKS